MYFAGLLSAVTARWLKRCIFGLKLNSTTSKKYFNISCRIWSKKYVNSTVFYNHNLGLYVFIKTLLLCFLNHKSLKKICCHLLNEPLSHCFKNFTWCFDFSVTVNLPVENVIQIKFESVSGYCDVLPTSVQNQTSLTVQPTLQVKCTYQSKSKSKCLNKLARAPAPFRWGCHLDKPVASLSIHLILKSRPVILDRRADRRTHGKTYRHFHIFLVKEKIIKKIFSS